MGQATVAQATVMTPMRRLVRFSTFVLTGIAGVLIGMAILTALAHPAGAAPLPVSPNTPGAPSVALVPTIQNIPASTPTVTPIVTPASRYVGPMAAPASLPGATVRAATPAAVSSIGSVAPPVLSAVRNLSSGASGLLPSLGGTVLALTDHVLLMTIPATSPGAGLPSATAEVGTITGVDHLLPAHEQGRTAGRGSGTPSSERAPTPLSPAPFLPYPSPRSPLTTGDAFVASNTGQGTSPFGSLPPSGLLLAALTFGAVSLTGRRTPKLLLDTRCSPPG